MLFCENTIRAIAYQSEQRLGLRRSNVRIPASKFKEWNFFLSCLGLSLSKVERSETKRTRQVYNLNPNLGTGSGIF